MGVKRKQHSAEFKARVAMAALSGEKTLAELSVEFGVHPTMISGWKQELVKRADELFARGSKAPAVEDAQKVIDDLHRKIEQPGGRARFSCRAARHLPIAERRAMIAPEAVKKWPISAMNCRSSRIFSRFWSRPWRVTPLGTTICFWKPRNKTDCPKDITTPARGLGI